MPRTLPAALTTAMDSGAYEPYIRVKLNADPNDTDAVTFETDYYRLDPLSATVRVYNPNVVDDTFFCIVRGATINGTPVTIASIWFRLIRRVSDGTFDILHGEPLQKNYLSIAADSTYEDVIETALISTEPHTITPSYEGSAAWKAYQFYPTGKNIILSPRKALFTLLQQKYLVFATEDGWDGANNNIFFFVATDARATDYTVIDLLLTIVTRSESRKLVTRDENDAVRTNGSATDPIHNLGFLLSTASLPTNASNILIGSHTSKIPIHLKYRTGDKVILSGNNLLTNALRIKVTEVLDTKSTPAWYQIIEPLVWFGSGGQVDPSIIDTPRRGLYLTGYTLPQRAPTPREEGVTNQGAAEPLHAPLHTGRFGGALSENDNTVQEAFETLDGHSHSRITETFALTGDITAALSASQNNYNPTGLSTASVIRLTASNDYNITGLAGGADGRIIAILNVDTGSDTITLKDEDGASDAANRFALFSDIVLKPGGDGILLIYDATDSRWRPLSTFRSDAYITNLILATIDTFVPFGVYGTISPISTSPAFPFSASIDRNMTLIQWGQTWYVATTNNGSNYWTIAIERVTDSSVINTFNTSGGSADTFTVNTDTTFAIGSVTSSDKAFRIRCTKTGSPGDLSLLGPILQVTT